MAVVTLQERQCELGSYYPAGSVVETATSQRHWDVVCKRRESGEPSCGNRENLTVTHNNNVNFLIRSNGKTNSNCK